MVGPPLFGSKPNKGHLGSRYIYIYSNPYFIINHYYHLSLSHLYKWITITISRYLLSLLVWFDRLQTITMVMITNHKQYYQQIDYKPYCYDTLSLSIDPKSSGKQVRASRGSACPSPLEVGEPCCSVGWSHGNTMGNTQGCYI